MTTSLSDAYVSSDPRTSAANWENRNREVKEQNQLTSEQMMEVLQDTSHLERHREMMRDRERKNEESERRRVEDRHSHRRHMSFVSGVRAWCSAAADAVSNGSVQEEVYGRRLRH